MSTQLDPLSLAGDLLYTVKTEGETDWLREHLATLERPDSNGARRSRAEARSGSTVTTPTASCCSKVLAAVGALSTAGSSSPAIGSPSAASGSASTTSNTGFSVARNCRGGLATCRGRSLAVRATVPTRGVTRGSTSRWVGERTARRSRSTPGKRRRRTRHRRRVVLEENAEYDADEEVATIPRLFSRYRGDFGGKRGILEFLREYNAVPAGRRRRSNTFDRIGNRSSTSTSNTTSCDRSRSTFVSSPSSLARDHFQPTRRSRRRVRTRRTRLSSL